MDVDELTRVVAERAAASATPIVVGISGYGGAGKSTLARELVDRLGGIAVRMRGDDFLDPVRSHRPSEDWDGVDRERLIAEVLEPFRAGRAGSFRRFDWTTRSLADPEPLPIADVMVVDLVGLFHPSVLPRLDLTVWCDLDHDTATRRGMARDRASGSDHDLLWLDVWEPNDRAFDARFSPRAAADVVIAQTSGRPAPDTLD